MKVITSVFLIVFFSILPLSADHTLYNNEDIQPMKNYNDIHSRGSDTVLISPDANWRGIVNPGRNIIVHGDTVSVVYSQTTSDPNYFQRLYHAYSTNGGATWASVPVSQNDLMRTSPHQAQIFDLSIDIMNPYSSTPYLFWMESGIYFAYDETPPFQLFNPVQIMSSGNMPTGCVWDMGNKLFATALDGNTNDIYGATSQDHGVTWDSTIIVPAGSSSGQVAAMIDRTFGGGAMIFFSRQEVPGHPIFTYYMETTDYGESWTAHQPLMYVEINDSLGQTDTLSMTWQGYTMIMDADNAFPYILAKLDCGKDPSQSYNFGELYFTKPDGGSSGYYTFDVDNPISVVEGVSDSFEHIAGYPTIGMYQDVNGVPMLYSFFIAYIDSNSTMYSALWAATSEDEGNTWNINIVSPFLDTTFAWYFPSCSYYLDNSGNVHVVMIKEHDHADNQHLHMYHIKFNVETDLGMPAPGPYVGVEEYPIGNSPSIFDISVSNNGIFYSFNISVPAGGLTSLKIYDMAGREISVLVNRHLSAGNYDYSWTVKASANYIYRMTSDGFSQSGKISIIE